MSLLEDGVEVLPKLYNFDIPARLGPVKRLDGIKIKAQIDTFASALFLPLVAEYYGGRPPEWIEGEYITTWPHAGEPSGSELWHKDHGEGKQCLRAMIYLCDVTLENGPLCYAPGTQTGGFRGIDRQDRLDDDEFDAVVPRDDWVTITGPKGTTILFDVLGYHRGLKAKSGERQVLLYTYHSLPNMSGISLM